MSVEKDTLSRLSLHDMPEQPNPLRALLNRIALVLLRGTSRILMATGPTLSRWGRAVARVILLPVYYVATAAGLRSRRLMMPARGLVVFAFSNRYLFHAAVVGIALTAIAANLTVRQVNAQDVGQNSLLYTIVTGEESRIIEQNARPELLVEDSHYAGPASLLALPDIDFDYVDEDIPLTAVAVPGTIVADVTPHAPDEPTGPTAPRTDTETYTVQVGDTLSAIAQKFGVNVGTILWANARTELQYLRPGDTLKIPPVSGILVTVKKGDTVLALANKYGSDADEIIRVNRLSPDEALPIGVELTLPGGRPVAAPIAVRPTPRPSEPVPAPGAPRPANLDTSQTPANKLLWPTSGRVITQYYGWRHTGLDIDGDYTSPIYASADGTVTTAGWNSSGYGMQIVITSPGGVMTRYAHASKMFVKKGDAVKKGEVIAMVGTTGRSTGTHLHYEVYVNGKRVNPLSYTTR